MTRAAIYTRISRDPSGQAVGVARQLVDCEKLCDQRGWEVVARLEDNDKSAYSGKERPGYLALLDLVADGAVDVVVAWHSDRLWRSVLDQQVFLATGREAGLELVATPSGEFEPGDADGEFMSTLLAAVARKSSQDMSRRIRRAMQERAERGEIPGGPRSFGYSLDRQTVIESEAAMMRDAAARLLAGEPASAIAHEWNEAGSRGTRGGLWMPATLVRSLMSPRVVGRRQHGGVVVGEAQWPAVLDVATWEALVSMVEGRAGKSRRSPRKHLLTGLAVCGKCKSVLGGSVSSSRRGPCYTCPPPVRQGCSGVVVSAKRAEEWVRAQVIERVDSDEFTRWVAEQAAAVTDSASAQAELVARLGVERRRLENLDLMLGAGDLSEESYVRTSRQVRELVEMTTRELAELSSAGMLASIPSGEELAATWDDEMSFSERRALLDAVVERIVVAPAAAFGPRFHPERLSIEWRG